MEDERRRSTTSSIKLSAGPHYRFNLAVQDTLYDRGPGSRSKIFETR